MRSEAASISLQGVKFWSTVCDCEKQLAREAPRTSRYYALGVLPYLVPVLTELLARTTRNLVKASSECLSLLASYCSLIEEPLPKPSSYIEQALATVAQLMAVTERRNANYSLLSAAYEALSNLLACSRRDCNCFPMVLHTPEHPTN